MTVIAGELAGWQGELGREIVWVGLLRATEAGLTFNPELSLLRAAGAARARTIRARVRTWQRLALWLHAACGVRWPTGTSQVTDYLEERAAETCGRSVPRSVLAALSFMEEKGDVAE